eukprot:263060-Rhodomonas_salina.2
MEKESGFCIVCGLVFCSRVLGAVFVTPARCDELQVRRDHQAREPRARAGGYPPTRLLRRVRYLLGRRWY